MNKLKKDLINKFYIEAPDQLEIIKSKIELNPTNNYFLKLKKQNLYLKYSNLIFVTIFMILCLVVTIQLVKPKPEFERISITEYIDVTLRAKVREENIKEIYGVFLPLSESERVVFIETFQNFNLNRYNNDVYLTDFDYIYYRIVFKDNSEIVVKVYENNIVSIEVEGNYFYSFEHNAYDKLN